MKECLQTKLLREAFNILENAGMFDSGYDLYIATRELRTAIKETIGGDNDE